MLFSVLPPHFRQAADATEAIALCFPNAPPSLARILEMSLASLVYHHDFLRQTLPAKHPLFSTPLFSDPQLLNNLRAKVTAGTSDPSMTATGLPPFILIMNEVKECRKEVTAVIPAVESSVPKVVGGVTQVLEDRAIGAGTVTRDGLRNMLNEVLNKAGLFEAVERMRASSGAPSAPPNQAQESNLFMWNGSFHRVPQTFTFPVGGALVCWQHYCCGDATKGYPPLQQLEPRDMPSKNLRKRLSDYLYLMKRVERLVKEKGGWIAKPTLAQANEMFAAGQEALSLPPLPSNRQRRVNQMKWQSVVQLLRKSNASNLNE